MKKTPHEFLSARLAASREIISALKNCRKKTFGFDGNEIEALIWRLEECADPANHFIAKDAVNYETGECYDAVGNFWSCGSKLCPTCISRTSRENRKKLRDAINRQTLEKNERYSFATFTITNPNLSLVRTRALVNRSWELFRKRKLCADLIRGAAKSEEFTLTKNGFHYHLHTILLSQYLHFNEVRRVWTECVETAFREAGLELSVQTKDKNLFVKIIRIKNLEKTIFEVCKYITKSDSWYKMRDSDLTEVALIKRWNRMFELLGSFKPEPKEKPAIDGSSNEEPIVHTRSLSDGEKPSIHEAWRDLVVRVGLETYREILLDEIIRTREARLRQICIRWPTASIEIASEF